MRGNPRRNFFCGVLRGSDLIFLLCCGAAAAMAVSGGARMDGEKGWVGGGVRRVSAFVVGKEKDWSRADEPTSVAEMRALV